MTAQLFLVDRRVHPTAGGEHAPHACPGCGGFDCVCDPDYLARLDDRTPFPTDPRTARGGDEERAFVHALGLHITDRTTRLVFADWLDDHGRADEAAVLRDAGASPVVAPFRVLPYSRRAGFFAALLRRPPADFDEALLRKRLRVHDEIHGGGARAAGVGSVTRVLLLDDAEAVLAGIDRWPLAPGEPPPVVRTRRVRVAGGG